MGARALLTLSTREAAENTWSIFMSGEVATETISLFGAVTITRLWCIMRSVSKRAYTNLKHYTYLFFFLLVLRRWIDNVLRAHTEILH